MEYDPGDEFHLTAGIDYRLGRWNTGGWVSLDGTYALYGADTFGGMEFETGDALTLTAQWAGTLSGHSVTCWTLTDL